MSKGKGSFRSYLAFSFHLIFLVCWDYLSRELHLGRDSTWRFWHNLEDWIRTGRISWRFSATSNALFGRLYVADGIMHTLHSLVNVFSLGLIVELPSLWNMGWLVVGLSYLLSFPMIPDTACYN
jgi:hypothetical protein